ncbi:MAG TPA: inorganic phosphate transporter [Methanomicrobiales archaeon]|nr:inorganic phosphate transporter [Methanomicrobiales archaeon]
MSETMISPTPILIGLIILVALAFDFMNGFHDSANAISTVVSTKVLSPRQAVLFAASFNFVAAFTFGVAVASTISNLVKLDYVPITSIPWIHLAALIGAIGWNVATWYLGLPTSSSHAIIGGLLGAGIASSGVAAIKLSTVIFVVIFMVLSPVIGMTIGFLFMVGVLWLAKETHRSKVDTYFRKLQLFSAGAYSFSHGSNDAQKTMGIITPLLFSIGYFGTRVNPDLLPVPIWVILAAHTAIALGTLSGGWRIVRTMGYKITRLRPVDGFAAESASAATIISASLAGIPVSTTHIITSSIMGVGTTRGTSAVKWGMARSIIWAWFLTIPVSALIGYTSFSLIAHVLP